MFNYQLFAYIWMFIGIAALTGVWFMITIACMFDIPPKRFQTIWLALNIISAIALTIIVCL